MDESFALKALKGQPSAPDYTSPLSSNKSLLSGDGTQFAPTKKVLPEGSMVTLDQDEANIYLSEGNWQTVANGVAVFMFIFYLIMSFFILASDPEYTVIHNSAVVAPVHGTLMVGIRRDTPVQEACYNIREEDVGSDIFDACEATYLPRIATQMNTRHSIVPGSVLSPTFLFFTVSIANMHYFTSYAGFAKTSKMALSILLLVYFAIVAAIALFEHDLPINTLVMSLFSIGFSGWMYLYTYISYQEIVGIDNFAMAIWRSGQTMQYYYPKLLITVPLIMYAVLSLVHPGGITYVLNLVVAIACTTILTWLILDQQMMNTLMIREGEIRQKENKAKQDQENGLFYKNKLPALPYNFRNEKFAYLSMSIIMLILFVVVYRTAGEYWDITHSIEHDIEAFPHMFLASFLGFIAIGSVTLVVYIIDEGAMETTLYNSKREDGPMLRRLTRNSLRNKIPLMQKTANIRYFVTLFIDTVMQSVIIYVYVLHHRQLQQAAEALIS